MDKLECHSPTEALIKALEKADKMKYVAIVYETLDGESKPYGIIIQQDMTVAQVNYLVDVIKCYLLKL